MTASGVVANQGTDTFIHTPIPPTTVTTPNFFIGFLITQGAGQFAAAFDESAPLFNRSFIAGDTEPGTGDINDLTNNELPVAPIEDYLVVGNWLIRAESGPFGLERVFSEKNGWDIDLSLSGTGVEDRSGGSSHDYELHFVFSTPLASVAGATTSCGSVASFAVDPDDASQVEVDLTGVDCNASDITVTVNGLMDTMGNTLALASLTFGLLNGDINGDGAVNRADYHEVKSHFGQPVNRHNFRADVSANDPSHIDPSDLRLVRRELGTKLP